MKQNIREKQITIPADLSQIDRIADITEQFTEGASERDVKAMQVSIEELFVNICSYAYDEEYQGERDCTISWHLAEQEGRRMLSVCIKDKGRPFDPVAKEDPDITLKIRDRGIGGMGVLMVKRYMDRVTYEHRDGYNITLLEKSWNIE